MKTDTKTKITRIKLEPITEEPQVLFDHAAERYIKLRQQAKLLADQRDELAADIRRTMTERGLTEAATPHGTFRLETRESLDWEVRDLKDIFGPGYTEYLRADCVAVKAKMGLQGAISERLAKKAIRTTTVALTLK